MHSKVIYAGTFDPLTLGHLDLIERASHVFEHVVLAVAVSAGKGPLFSVEERVALAQEVTACYPNVQVDSFDSLLVEYARKKGIHLILRGLRAFSDFEFEFQLALMNRRMDPEIESIYLMPSEQYSYLNSSSIREIASLRGDVSAFCPEAVVNALKEKFK